MKFSRDAVLTGGVGDRETTELDRRSQDVTRLNGKVKEVDYKRKPPVYRAEFGDPKDEDDYILTDWLPASGGRAQGDVDTHFLEVGERVTLHSEGGEFATAQLQPAGTYTEEDERQAGSDKAGVYRKKFKTGAEISYDRDTGDMIFRAKGKKKQEQSQGDGSGGSGNNTFAAASSSGGGSGSGSGDQDIKGSITLEIADVTFVMKDGKLTVNAGGTSFTFGKDGFIQKGGKQEHDGKNVGKDHKHGQVETGAGKTGDPE